jgi:dihydroorotase
VSARAATGDTLRLPRPDDWHLHLRDGAELDFTLPPTARVFARALVMPNLVPPVATPEAARAYRGRIAAALAARAPGTRFEPLFALYLTERTDPALVHAAAVEPCVAAFKLYPAGATTHSEAGVRDLAALADVFAALEEVDLPLCVHGESPDPAVDVFDREAVFLERELAPLCRRFPRLRVVLEHVSTAEGVAFVESARAGVAATLTPQHLLLDRNDLFAGGLSPHHYCLPVLKRRRDQEALQRAALSGNPRFFLGTDSAPHARGRKESAAGCAGCFSAPGALPLYAELFERAGALPRLGPFAAEHGADFYRRPRNAGALVLERRPWRVPASLEYSGGETIVPLWAGRELAWRVAE